MKEFVQLLVLGMATGGLYTVNALGFVVIFRSSGIINFAGVGATMMGAYFEWQLADQWKVPIVLAVALAVLGAAVVSLLIYLLAIRPLTGASTLTQVIATLAVFVGIEQLVTLVFGGLTKVPTAILPTGSVHLGGVALGSDSLTILISTAALTFGLAFAYRHTRFGLATSALSESPRSLAALGWSIGRLRAANWAVAGALAGLAGAALGPILQLTPGTFTDLLVPTLAGALIGGFSSFPLTLAGGLVIGALQAEAARYVTLSGTGDAVPFLLIIAVLVLRGRSLPLRDYVQARLPRVGSGEIPWRRVVIGISVVAVAAMFVKNDWVIGATFTLMTAIILLSQMVITGYAGQLSLAQLALGGLGAIVAANVSVSYGLPFLLSLVVGMAAAIPVSIVVGLPSLRARGVSLAVATLGFAVAINSVVLNNDRFAGGLDGLSLGPQTIFGLSINSTTYPRRYFFVCLAVFAVFALAATNLRRGRTGRRMIAVRTNERAAAALGVGVTATKLYAFVIAGVIAAAGGVLLAFNQALPQFTGYDPLSGLSNLIGSVLGGIGYVGGALIGGLFSGSSLPNSILYPYVANLTWWTELVPLVTAGILILQLRANPDGIADVAAHGPPTTNRRRRRAASALAAATARSATDSSATVSYVAGSTVAGGAEDVDGRPSGGAVAQGPSPRTSPLGRFSGAHRRATQAEHRRRRYAKELAAVDESQRRPHGGRLVARDIRVTFGVVAAVDGVDLIAEPGQVLAVIGPNGAGKTTLMDAITGFVPMAGTVELDGARVDDRPVHRRARAGIARSFQSLELLEDMTVMDNLRCAADHQDAASLFVDLFHPNRGTLTPATVAAIKQFGLEDKLDKMPTEISYGDRRLVAIARAVASEPLVLLLDEPAAGLSGHERAEVARIVTMMAQEWNIAVILIEHDVDLVRQVSDRVIALDFGQPIASGTADEVLADPAVVQAYLGAPVNPDLEKTDQEKTGTTAGGSVPTLAPG